MWIKLTAPVKHNGATFKAGKALELDEKAAKRLLALKVAVALEEQTQATAAKTPKSENEQNEDDENEQNEDEDNDDGKDDDDDEGGGGYTPLSVDALNKMTNAQILNELAVIGVSTKGSENKQQLIALYTKAVKE